MSQLEVDNISREFATVGEPLRVLRGVSLELAAGGNCAVVGPSGSGKSTLLQIVGTLDRPTAGTVRIGGVDPFTLDEPELADFRNREIGFVFQDHYLLPQCTAIENVLLPTLARESTTADADRALDLLRAVGLESRREHRPGELSGGERQRVALARALILAPGLLLADEPTGNLDSSSAADVGRLLLDLQERENSMLIVVTHSAPLAALMQQTYQLDAGLLQREAAEPSPRE